MYIPALEGLERAWSSRIQSDKYEIFGPALKAGVRKTGEYYKKAAGSLACVMAMCKSIYSQIWVVAEYIIVLNPKEKGYYFKTHGL